MRTPFSLLALLAAFLAAAPALAQPTLEAQLKRFGTVTPETATPADCDAGVAKAATINAFDLFHAGIVCLAAKKSVEGNFLISAGQVRAMADMALMEPEESGKEPASSLYGLIFFYFGGPGDEEVLRDPQAMARMLALFDAWSPVLGPDYDPGWPVAKRPETSAYFATVVDIKAHRRKQLLNIARAFSDPEYYAAHRQFADLQKRTGAFVEGSPEAKEADRLQGIMDARIKALGIDFGN